MKNQSYKVLVVDDDETILYLLEKILSTQYECISAKNALDALKIMESEPIDIVLTDIHMPEMDGVTFLKKVKNLKPHIPVIIMTADPNMPLVKTALKEGAIDFLEKPFDLDNIFEVISRYAAKRITGRVVSVKNKAILLVTNRDNKNQLRRALASTQGNLVVVATEAEALEILRQQPFDLMVRSIEEGGMPNPEFHRETQSLSPHMKSICVLEQYDMAQMSILLDIPNIDSIVFKNNTFSESEFLVGIRKLFSRDIFGLEKYLRWGFEPIQHVTQHTDDRFQFIERMSEFLRSLKISNHFISRLENVADEFLSNALYNAPVKADGSPLYRATERTSSRACTEREKCILSYAYDGRYFGISIQDNFGAITKQDIFNGIRRCLEEQGNPSQKAGGAGLGLYLSFLTLNKFIINVSPGQKTEMIGLCDIRSSLKEYNLLDKSLTMFMES
ncbi:MAG: response regulator [SAR324 cluster bacterium]|nr:response regulator [SAR324 cluster bacterium]